MPFTVKIDPNVTTPQAQVIPDASLFNDGVMSKAQVAVLVGVARTAIALEPVNIFVNGVTGSDSNFGTAASPVATVQKALSLVPAAWTKTCEIHVAAGTYNLILPSGFITVGTPIGPDALPLAIIGEVTIIATGTATANNAAGTNLVDALLALPINGVEGRAITVLTGANAGQRRLIRENTATMVQVNVPLPNAVAIDDQFTVEQPATIINYDSCIWQKCGTMVMRDITWNANSPFSFFSHVFYTQNIVENVEWALNGSVLGGNHHSELWGLGQPFPLDNPGERAPCGAYVHDGSVVAGDRGSLQQFYVLRNVFMVSFDQSMCDLNSPDAKNTSFLVGDASAFLIFGDPAFPGRLDGQVFADLGAGILTIANSYLLIDGMNVSNSGGDGILAEQRATCALGTVGGSGNARAGLHVKTSSQATIDIAGPGSTTVTGTSGNVEFATTTIPTIFTYAAINTPDGAGVAGISDAYGNRVEPAA